MKHHFSVLSVCGVLCLWASVPTSLKADASHARIVRLSLVQGDVRYVREFHKDPLTDTKAAWERAPLNLPIRQGYAVATDNGRAEVEFENGAMAFLNANTVLEFYDLSLQDGTKVSRLVLRQGSATFYVHPERGDYFSVTGGDFTVEANGRGTFRLDDFDDGSNINVELGHVAILHNNDKSVPLEKGQSLSVRAGDNAGPTVGRVADSDDFDRWVSGRIESVVTATNNSAQYVNSPNYRAGFADLYTYGSWFPVGGYGYGWRPFGVGLGWCPFDTGFGNWYYDSVFGWSFYGSAPWGWLPYHYGGWVFSPVYGWTWVPTGFGYAGLMPYRPVTAVWVRSGTTLGIVPIHPTDGHGKTAANLSQGVFSVQAGRVAPNSVTPGAGEKWSTTKQAPRDAFSNAFVAASAPTRISRSLVSASSSGAARPATASRDSSIVYDANEHRFVNSNRVATESTGTRKIESTGNSPSTSVEGAKTRETAKVPGRSQLGTSAPARNAAPAPRAAAVPPPAPVHTSGGNSRASSGATMGGSAVGSGGTTHPSSTTSSHPSGGGRPH